MASALSVLADLNAQLESASQVAEDLEREMDGALPAPRILRERSGLSCAQRGVRAERSGGQRVLGAPQETFDVGPGEYDVKPTAVGKRVPGGRWGSNKRFKQGQEADDSCCGPGQYDPNQSFVKPKRPGVKIVPPTRKTLAMHLRAFEREQDAQGVGPGKYSPSFFATSEWASVPRVSICPAGRPDEKLQQHILEEQALQAGQAPGAYDFWAGSELSRSGRAVQWRPKHAPEREPELLPGPGAYSPDYAAVKGHVSEVRMAPSEAGSRSSRSRTALSERSSFLQPAAEGPGPGSYNAEHDGVRPRAPSAVIKKHETKSLKVPPRHEGDMLVLNPDHHYAKPSVRCSVVMKEASFLSQASTVPGEDAVSDSVSVQDVDLSVLSTKPRSLSFSMGDPGKRPEPMQANAVGPGSYEVKYDYIEPDTRATRVLRSSTKRLQLDHVASSACKLVLDTERADNYLRPAIGVPNIGSYSSRPLVTPGQIVSDFTGENDYDAAQAKLALQAHTPAVNIGKESKRAEFASVRDSNADLGPGTYEVDDSLVHPRAQSAFISSTVVRERTDDGEGDALVLDITAADALVAKRVPVPVNMEKTVGRVDPKKDPTPEALEYVTDERDRAKPGEPIPGVKGLKFDGQVGRPEPKGKDEGADLFGKYDIDYSQVEVQAPAADFSRVTGRQADDADAGQDTQDGNVLVLDALKAHDALRTSRKLVLDMSKQVARPEEVAGQLVSDFTGDADYEAELAARNLHAHVPGVDIGKLSERQAFDAAKDKNPNIGPGAYEVDDTLVHPRVPSAFISNTATHEPEMDFEGDELDLDPTAADNLVRNRIPAPVDMARTTGRSEPKAGDEERQPEALDYVPDSRDRLEPGQVIPGVVTLAFGSQVGRTGMHVEGEGSHLLCRYTPDHSLQERKVAVLDFGKASGREVPGADESEDMRDGDVLVLEPERGHAYLRRSTLVVDIGKQTPRPEELAGQRVSECDPLLEYEPNLAAVLPHVPQVQFDKMLERTAEKADPATERLGPGSYDVKDELTHPRPPSVVFGQPPPVDDDTCEAQQEGDVLILHPEHADKITRPVVHGFANVFQQPALDSEWAHRTRTVASLGGEGSDGQVVTIPSIRKRVNWHRLSQLISEWNRTVSERNRSTAAADKHIRPRIYQESTVDMKAQTGHAKTKVDLGAKLGFNLVRGDCLPTFQHIFAGGQLEKAQHRIPALEGSGSSSSSSSGRGREGGGGGGVRKGDTLVMITAPHGRSTDLRRWLRPPRVPASGRLPRRVPADLQTSRVVSQLGPWRECAVDVNAEASSDSEEAGSTFFYHVVTHKRTWAFNDWRQQSLVLSLINETLQSFGYPLTLHVQRPQSRVLHAVVLRELDDSMSGAYNPKHDIVEAAPKGVVDFVAVAGRDLSFDAKTKYELFRSRLMCEAKRTTPSAMMLTDKELEAAHLQQLARLRETHEAKVRELTASQESERKLELEAIKEAAERQSPSSHVSGEDAQEELFASMMQENVLGDAEVRRQALIRQLDVRQAAERKALRTLVRREERMLQETQARELTALISPKDIEALVDKQAYQQRLELDPAERLRETERQRRRRLPRAGTGLQHTAEYSHGAPAAAERWLDSGKSHRRADQRGLSDAEVADWKANSEYKGLRPTDQLVKWFWQLIESWGATRRAQVLQLCTGTAAAPKGGFGYLAGHDIKRPDGAYKFSLRKQQPQGPPNASVKSPSLHQVRAFAALNRLYLPEYKSKRELARGLEEAVHAMLHGKAAHAAGDEAPRGGSTLMNGLECQLVEAPPSHMFTIFE